VSENVRSIFMRYLPHIRKLYGVHLRKVILQWTPRAENSVDESDVTLLIFVDLREGEIEQYSEYMSAICSDMLIEYSIWANPVVKSIDQLRGDIAQGRFDETISNEQSVVYEADEKN